MPDSAASRDIPPPRGPLIEILTGVVVMLGLFAGALHFASCGRWRGHNPTPRATQDSKPAAAQEPLPAADIAPPPRGKHIVVAYSSNLLGEYEPCG